SVITKMGFTNYFLIVYDMIRYAKTQNILVGPGRGSAAGSLVAYCLGITHIDPIKNQLLFERFLNPERISMPDIDTDFPDTSRHKIIEYLQAQYGADHVALIVTFSALKAKQALRDVARVKNIPNLEIDSIVRLIPNVPNMNLNKAWNEISAFRSKIQSKASYLDLFHTALKIENLPRHTSQHAAGVVLSQKEIVEVCPIYAGDGTIQSTQFTMDYLESLGLIKMDVLALKNLTTVENILSDLKKTYGLELDIYKLNQNDKKTYALLSSGDTIGVFQFESDGIRSLLRDIRPQTFSDIAIALALYRPGPMENKNVYLANRNHPETIHYLHPLLEPILKETCGIMIYQEQIMQIAQTIGNMTLAQADSLRKAMSKKNKALMDSYEEIFIQGATAQNIKKEIATKIFKTMEHFADYGFNKSHSYAYASLAYAMAYLKANYPLFFYRSLLDSVTGNKEKSADYIFECSKRNVPVLPCSIVSSTDRYCIENNGIRMPFQVLKGIGKTVYDKIIQERKKKPFQDLYECMARLIACGIKENALITLINAGAFDPLYPSRKTLAENLDQIISYANLVKVEDETLHFDFSVASPPNLIRLEEQVLERAQKEKEVYGFYLSEHPISSLRKKRFQNLRTLREISEQLGFVSVLGRVSRIKPYRTKKGDLMAFLTLEDETQMIDVAIMPRLYGQIKGSLQENQIILLNGKKDRKDSILAQKIQILSFDL
ncbi:DNA polymerase III subunit alpha, partial [Dubosiella newyorkensis]